jgi:hypothetical protein
VFHQINQPAITDRRRVAGLRFGDDRVHALLRAVAINRLGLDGFNNRDLRALVAELLGVDPATITAGRMTYDLRRLRLHGLTSAYRTPTDTCPPLWDGEACGSTITPTTGSSAADWPRLPTPPRPRHRTLGSPTCRRGQGHPGRETGIGGPGHGRARRGYRHASAGLSGLIPGTSRVYGTRRKPMMVPSQLRGWVCTTVPTLLAATTLPPPT